MFQHHDGAAVRQREGRGRIFIRGLQRREHVRRLEPDPSAPAGGEGKLRGKIQTRVFSLML